jgi:2-(1,2-epoxy-1,2-dihydrophenyl)acetyl-CoA isomerase
MPSPEVPLCGAGPAEHAEIALRLYPVWAAGDRAVLDELLASEFAGFTTPDLPLDLGGSYSGARAMRGFWREVGRAYDLTARPHRAQVLADGRVVVSGRYRGHARTTGRALDAAFTHTITVADKRLAGLIQLTDARQWRAALEPGEGAPVTTTLTVSQRNGLAELGFQRGEFGNSFDPPQAVDLRLAAERIGADPAIRALVITSSGPRFCVGGDVNTFLSAPPEQRPGFMAYMVGNFHEGLARLAELRIPVVCAVRGSAAGGGLGPLFAADLVVAADDAFFVLGYGRLGLSPDGGATWYLPRILGPARTARLCLQNVPLTAADALAAGLVNELLPADQVDNRAREIAAELAAGPTAALGATRALLRGPDPAALRAHLDAELDSLTELVAAPEAAEGLLAFTQRRPPKFWG